MPGLARRHGDRGVHRHARAVAALRGARGAGGEVVALVSAGITLGSVGAGVLGQVPFVHRRIAIALAAIGVAAAWLARRLTRRIAGDLPASAVRDAVSSYESVRTLGEALRAQTHEHGNRMHTAVALIELGRSDEAVELLTETSRVSQDLVDRVLARDGDPTVAALLLGKASQAKERGIEWSVDVDPTAPRSVLGPVDAVSVVGNLIDNAIDAAAAGPEPRWVRVRIAPAGDELALTFSDSGTGVDPRLRERIFEHGFSTKPAGAAGRGVGLALVRDIVSAVGRNRHPRAGRSPRRSRSLLRRGCGVMAAGSRSGRVVIGVLIVDDERLTRELHRQYVERLPGFRVVAECAGARAAVTAVLESPPEEGIDLVLLDMTMPDGHGLDVARHIRARASDVDIIAITGVRDADVVRQAVALGVAQYLLKPFTFATFRERLEQYEAFRAKVSDVEGQATQAEVDALLGSLRPPASVDLPKGLSAHDARPGRRGRARLRSAVGERGRRGARDVAGRGAAVPRAPRGTGPGRPRLPLRHARAAGDRVRLAALTRAGLLPREPAEQVAERATVAQIARRVERVSRAFAGSRAAIADASSRAPRSMRSPSGATPSPLEPQSLEAAKTPVGTASACR